MLLPVFPLSLCRHHAKISLSFNSVANASWAPIVRRFEGRMKDLIPKFCTYKPAPPLRAKWASILWSTLSGLNNEFDLQKNVPHRIIRGGGGPGGVGGSHPNYPPVINEACSGPAALGHDHISQQPKWHVNWELLQFATSMSLSNPQQISTNRLRPATLTDMPDPSNNEQHWTTVTAHPDHQRFWDGKITPYLPRRLGVQRFQGASKS